MPKNVVPIYTNIVFALKNLCYNKTIMVNTSRAKLTKTLEYIIVASMVLATIGLGMAAGSIRVKADGAASANASVTVAEACSMSTANTAPHSTTMVNNDTAENVGVTTFTATCNDPGGLAIYAIGYSNDEYGNTNMIGTLGNIATGTNDSTSNWSMKLMNTDGFTAPDFLQSTYAAVPSTYTKVASKNSNTTDATSFGVSATYRFHTSATQPADTYVGKVKYTMIHPATKLPQDGPMNCASGKICYSPNANDTEGTMATQSVSSSVTLLPSNFSRTGYGFAGWSDKYDYDTNPEAKFYGPMETITLNTADYSSPNPGLSLYAVWVKSQGNLQDSTKVASVCSSLTTAPTDGTANLSSVSALTDQRDNNTYAIAKLADSKCWMIENLRLADKDSNNNDIELSSTNTNNPSLPITNVYDASNPTTSNHLSPSVNPTATAWCKSHSADCDDQSMLYTGNITDRASTPTANSTSIYSHGNYYNWYSATAANGKYSKSTNNSTTVGDICPAGWALPEGGDKTNMAAEKNDFYKLGLSLGLSVPTAALSTGPVWINAEGRTASKTYRTYPNNFLYSGYVNGSSVDSRGSDGLYWSKSTYASYSAYSFFFTESFVDTPNYGAKYWGFSVRCLVQ